MPIECLISFDNNLQGVYYAGQEISGVVQLNVDTTKRIKAIHITVNGYAKIRWMKRGYPQDSERATCRAYRSYLSSRSYVLGTNDSTSCIEWPAGEYSYSFHIILPDNLPTSFNGKYGQIHYEIIAAIERMGRSTKIYKLPFTVIQPLDLNANDLYKVPIEIFDHKRFWSFCCPTGPLIVKLSTPYCGYAPGQQIHFILYINNQSSIDVIECNVKLKQEVIYESHNPQHEFRYDNHVIAQKQFGNVLRWSRKIYQGSLELPSIPPTTTLKLSCPITINYLIKIIIKPTDFHWKLKLKAPLIIGSSPIKYHTSTIQQLEINNNLNINMTMRNNNNNNNRETILATSNNNITTLMQLSDDVHSSTDNFNGNNQQVINSVTSEDIDDPPDYMPMLPPTYEEAMAITERFRDISITNLQNISMSCITNNKNYDTFKPCYPVFYDCDTPIQTSETIYNDISMQNSLFGLVNAVKSKTNRFSYL